APGKRQRLAVHHASLARGRRPGRRETDGAQGVQARRRPTTRNEGSDPTDVESVALEVRGVGDRISRLGVVMSAPARAMTMSEHEAAQVERANAAGEAPAVLLHGGV